MQNILATIKTFLIKYRKFIIPAIPLLFFLFLPFFLLSIPNEESPIPTPTISPAPTSQQEPFPTITGIVEEAGEDINENLEAWLNFQKKEVQADGTTVYFFKSENPNRPDIVVKSKNNVTIFSRRLSSSSLPLAPISIYNQAYGAPEKIIQGSKAYGPNSNIYLYASQGLVVIGDGQTENVFEEQSFSDMSVDEYLQRFGNQN